MPEHDTATANKALVRRYCQAFYNDKDFALAQTMLADGFVNHHPGAGSGPDATIRSFRAQIADRFPAFTLRIRRIVAGADYVWTHSLVSLDGETPSAVTVDIWRIADGMLAEHWDVAQQLPEDVAVDDIIGPP